MNAYGNYQQADCIQRNKEGGTSLNHKYQKPTAAQTGP